MLAVVHSFFCKMLNLSRCRGIVFVFDFTLVSVCEYTTTYLTRNLYGSRFLQYIPRT